MTIKSRPVLIAHRGASGYLPEHTLAAKALGFAMGADFLEQDVVATRDDELLVMHDIHVDRVSNVAELFPHRARDDSRFYVRDFDLDELRQLNIFERVNADGSAVYPGRFPARTGNFRVNTLREEIEFIQALNQSAGRTVGIYPEIKRPAWHLSEGVDIAPQMLALLHDYGYSNPDDPIYLQCFDAGELVRIREQLGSRLRLVQLIGDNSWGESGDDYVSLRKPAGLQRLAQTVDAIGPWVNQCFALDERGRAPTSSGLVEQAQESGLEVHPYTIRLDSLPDGFPDLASLVHFCTAVLQVDGLFTDFPDRVGQLLRHQTAAVS
ncbi:MAG TPA: glycerophosphodiester phosphodiesterase [Woeseiaceae bacterium]|nr:glycerophosphodiester phosphodiesterase [Woeseiaceae bacterium]